MPELYGTLSATGVLNGTLQTIVYADNYNNLNNKPAINGHTLQGDQTASDLGLLTLADVPVESVNGQTGTVVLDGADIPYAAGVSVNDKIDAVEASIPSVPVVSVNGQTGAVVLDGADIEYGAGISVNDQLDNLAGQIPSIPVESVNGQTGNVVLDGADINYNATKTVNQRLDEIYLDIPEVPVHSVNSKIGNVVLDGTDINYNASYTVNDRIDYVEGLIEAGDVVSVNGLTGVVVLEGSDIEYSAGVTINDQIDNVEAEIPTSGADIEYSEGVTVNDQIGTNTTDIGNIAADVGDLTDLTTTNKDSLVDAVNEVDGKITTATTVSSGSITPNTGYTVVNSSVKKIGNLVAVSFVIKATTAITSRQTIANIANGFRPTQNEWYTFSGSSIVNGTSNRIITGLITSSGDIMVGDGIEPAGQSVIEFRGSCTYYTA